MSNLLLTEQERHRFTHYLRLQAETSKGIIKQMEKAGMHEAMLKRERMLVLCSTFIADELESIESVNLGEGRGDE